MFMSNRELWTALHGMVLGATFLLAFSGGMVALWDIHCEANTEHYSKAPERRLAIWTWTMAILAWMTVILGTYVVYPWYRAKPPAGTIGMTLQHYPKNLLLSDPRTADWHEFGMEWKEHIAWLAPILATAVAVLVTKYPDRVRNDMLARRALLALFSLAFFTAMVAGLMGALINKAAPVR